MQPAPLPRLIECYRRSLGLNREILTLLNQARTQELPERFAEKAALAQELGGLAAWLDAGDHSDIDPLLLSEAFAVQMEAARSEAHLVEQLSRRVPTGNNPGAVYKQKTQERPGKRWDLSG